MRMANIYAKNNSTKVILVGMAKTLWTERGGLNINLAQRLTQLRKHYHDLTAHLFLPDRSDSYARARDYQELADAVLRPASLSSQVVFSDGIGFVDPKAGLRMAYHAQFAKAKNYKTNPLSSRSMDKT